MQNLRSRQIVVDSDVDLLSLTNVDYGDVKIAIKQFYHDIDLMNVGQLVGARAHNVTATEMADLALTLGVSNKGLFVYNTTDSKNYTWNGTAFVAEAIEVVGDVVFKGSINPTNAASVSKVNGYQYVVDAAGTLVAAGVTFAPSADVEVGDFVLFTSATTAQVLQRNDAPASETVEGNIRLATQAEVDAGVVADEAVTPATLKGRLDTLLAAQDLRDDAQEARLDSLEADRVKSFFGVVNLTALTPVTVTHGLNLVDRDSFVINTSYNNSQISLDVDSTSVNEITLTSAVALTGVAVQIVGKGA